jgi:hypothetical protein
MLNKEEKKNNQTNEFSLKVKTFRAFLDSYGQTKLHFSNVKKEENEKSCEISVKQEFNPYVKTKEESETTLSLDFLFKAEDNRVKDEVSGTNQGLA